MNYNTDKPIDEESQDLLGRAKFSNRLGKSIYEYNAIDGLVIGLFGKWGTGKTSVINMAVNQINKLAENDENKPVIIKFNPWNYSDKDNLISLFFQSLKNNINIQGIGEFREKIVELLDDYSDAFDTLTLIPIQSSNIIASLFKNLSKVIRASLRRKLDLDKTKETLEKELIKANKKIIIIIDDIDRLTNTQIRDVFQLVKQVADFPNVIYLLSMDRMVVSRALTDIHNINGNKYLEKIIQVPFELPELRKSKLNNIFFSKLDQIIKNISNEIVLDENYWYNVFKSCIEPYINTLRDVNRVINIFKFKYEMLYQETSFEDMLAITTLEVLEPTLYKWISNNKDAVCGGFMHGFSLEGHNKKDYYSLYYNEFENLGINPNLAIKCISTIFPLFAKDVNKYQHNYQQQSKIRSNMRVAYEERFELYFMLDLDDIKVSRSIINDCIFYFDKDELNIVVENINKDGNIVYFLEELKSLIDKIPDNRLEIIAITLLNLQHKFKDENLKTIFSLPSSYISEDIIFDISKKIKTEGRVYKIICYELENANKSKLGTIAKIINRIERAYGLLEADSEKDTDKIISLEYLKKLEFIYVEKITDIVNSETLLDIDNFNTIFHLWKSFDENSAEEYIKELFKDEINKLKFICTIAGRWNGSSGSGWGFDLKKYSKYISENELYNIVQNIDKNKLDRFTKIEQVKLASFYLNYNKSIIDRVRDQDALQLVNIWNLEKQ